MHIVLLNQYYPPDIAPTGVMLESVADSLIRQGHKVTVICASAGKEKGRTRSGAGGPRVIRLAGWRPGRHTLPGKLLGYVLYYSGVAWRLLWTRADVIVALTTPPYLSLLARFFSRLRGTRHAHWVMDLYPDVMVAHGMLKAGSFRHRFLAALTRWGFGGKRCAAVVTLGPDMAERVNALLPAGRTAAWVPLWGTAEESAGREEVAGLRQSRGWQPGDVVFLYSGNMGLGHRFVDIISAAKLAGEGTVRLAFFGKGKRRPEIETLLKDWPGGPHSVEGYVKREDLAAHLATGDVHLASLESSWDGTMVPSKLQGIFEAGRPVLFTGSRNSSIGRWILQSGAGWVCEPGDVAGHVAAMREALAPDVRAEKGEAARAFALEYFDQAKNSHGIAALFAGDTRSATAPVPAPARLTQS